MATLAPSKRDAQHRGCLVETALSLRSSQRRMPVTRTGLIQVQEFPGGSASYSDNRQSAKAAGFLPSCEISG